MPNAVTRVLSHLPVATLAPIAERFPDIDFVQVPTQGIVPASLRGEVLLAFTWGSPNICELVEHGVEWIHTVGTGIDGFPMDAVGKRLLTCARGASAIPMSEWTLAAMLNFEKQLPQRWAKQPPAQWNFAKLGGLYGRTVGLLGLGAVAEAIAKRAIAFGMRVRAIRRTTKPSSIPEVEIAPNLDDLLASADHLVVAMASTSETRHIIGRDALAKVKPGVHLVNVARGALVDQDALREALDAGRVARASLDVADPEPLPAGHWLYQHPQVFLTPHVSWSMPGSLDWILATFEDNLHRYLAGEALAGVVDRGAGY
jgi:phosphoglycerate dehydrogenase-like enzyme